MKASLIYCNDAMFNAKSAKFVTYPCAGKVHS